MTDEDGNGIDSDTIPQRILDACCEAARAVPYTQKVSSEQVLKRVKAGSVEVEYDTGKAERAEGGYRVSGLWPFSSGVDPSTWNMLGGVVAPDDDLVAPELVVDLKTVPGLDRISRRDDGLHVGALVTVPAFQLLLG